MSFILGFNFLIMFLNIGLKSDSLVDTSKFDENLIVI